MSGRRDNTARRNSLDLAPTPYMTRQAGAYTPPPSNSFLLLSDGTSYLLLSDGTSKLILEL